MREGYAAFGRGDVEAALTLLHPEIVVEVHTERADLPESPVYHGRGGFLENLRDVAEPFEDFQIEPEKFAGTAERLLVTARISGRGRASGAPFEAHIVHDWKLRDGQAVRLDIYPSMEAALAADRD